MAASDDEFGEFDMSSDAEDAMTALADVEASQGKRKRDNDDDGDELSSPKRACIYPQTSELARTVLKKKFGLPGFRLKQEVAVARLIAGGNATVIFPTGGGKSLCYQVPAVAFSDQDAQDGSRGPIDGGLTIVVSPLIALMKDQVDAMQKLGIYAVAIDSSKKRDEYLKIVDDLKAGLVKILYCAPERLNNEGFIAMIQRVRGGIRMVAVDEAHCVSEWGHSFRPDYLKVARFVKEIKAERVVCLTATATPKVAKDICTTFGIDEDGLYQTTMYRPNLRLLVQPTQDVQAKYPLLFKFLQANPGPTVVYATVQKQTEELADDLRKQGFNARHFHAGETTDYKTKVQDEFLHSENMIVCATIAFGMGIDKSDIRNVVHFDIPSSIEGYSQQIGRAGRDGKPSNCMFYACPQDYYLRDVFVYGDLPSTESVRRFIDAVCSTANSALRPGQEFEASHYAQSREFDIRPTALSILYAQLELHFGLIRATTPKYTSYQFEANSKYYVSGVRGSSSAADAVYRSAVKKAKFHHIDVDVTARSSGVLRREIVAKLQQWNDDNVIILKTSGLQNVYKIVKSLPATQADRQAIANTLFAQMHKREQQDLERTQDVVNLVTDARCLSRKLAEYFGGSNEGLPEECGHCSWCDTHKKVIIPPRTPMEHDEWGAVGQILAACPERDDPRFLARIAFGIKSPRITAMQYANKEFFASMSEHDFPALVRIFTNACDNDIPSAYQKAADISTAASSASSYNKTSHRRGKTPTTATTNAPGRPKKVVSGFGRGSRGA